jgi:acetyltransferase
LTFVKNNTRVETPAYPAHLIHERQLADGGRVVIRPIRADDQPALQKFFEGISGDALYLRFQKWVHAVSDKLLDFFTHIDYDRHMAFVCVAGEEIVGESRYVANQDGASCEFAVVISDAWHKTGIAGLLMEALIAAAQQHGMKSMEGLVLRENHDMLRFVRALGFEAHHDPHEPAMTRVIKRL